MATGRRVNISKIAPTALERDLREKAVDLNGFGIFQPITVPFEGPLDLENIIERHHDANLEPSNDVMYLLNIDPNSEKFGTAIPLDLGQGNFPVLMQPVPGDPYTEERGLCVEEAWTQDNYWVPLTSNGEPPYTREESTGFFNYCDPVWRNEIRDSHYDGTNLLFESHDETVDGIDLDGDGVIDEPNTLESNDDVWRELITFFEKRKQYADCQTLASSGRRNHLCGGADQTPARRGGCRQSCSESFQYHQSRQADRRTQSAKKSVVRRIYDGRRRQLEESYVVSR